MIKSNLSTGIVHSFIYNFILICCIKGILTDIMALGKLSKMAIKYRDQVYWGFEMKILSGFRSKTWGLRTIGWDFVDAQ